MKALLAIAFVVSTLSAAYSQDFKRIASLEIKTAEDAKSAEGTVLDAANYLLSTPLADTPERRSSVRLVIMWASATTYTFEIDAVAGDLFKKNEDVLGLIMASMTKTALENPDAASNQKELKLNSYKTLLDYCAVPFNNVKQTKEMKKAIEANKEGKLKEYLKL